MVAGGLTGAAGWLPAGLTTGVVAGRSLAPSVFCWAGAGDVPGSCGLVAVGDCRLGVVFGVGLVCSAVVGDGCVTVSVKELPSSVADGVDIVLARISWTKPAMGRTHFLKNTSWMDTGSW